MTVDDPRHYIADMPLFEGLSEEHLDDIASRMRMQRGRKGMNLVSLEQRGHEVYFIVEGTVRVQVEHQDGSRTILAFLGPGDMVGEMGVVERSTRSASVETLDHHLLIWMERSAFNSCLREIPHLAWNLCRVLSARLRFANQRIQLTNRDVATRLARILLHFAETMGKERADDSIVIPMRLTQQDLADLVGASRERVNRVLGEWRRMDLIEANDEGYLVLRNPERIDRLYPA